MESTVRKVFILTRTINDEMEIIAVFSSVEALEGRILTLVRNNRLTELTGLGMKAMVVMES